MASKTPALSSPSSPSSFRCLASPKKTGSQKNEAPVPPDTASQVPVGSALKGFAETVSAAAIEDNTHVILGNGRYQMRVLISAALAAAVMLSQALAYELIGRPVDHWCRPPDNMRHLPAHVWRNAAIPVDTDGRFSQCTMYDPPTAENASAERRVVECQEWDYDTGDRADSIISEWDLVCGRHWLRHLSVILFMLVAVAFVPASGALSDHWGRRPVILIMTGTLFSASLTAAVAETFPFFLIARLLVSGSCNSATMILCVLLYEMTGKERRALYCVWATGIGVTIPAPFLWAVGALQPRWALAQAVLVLPTTILVLLCYSLEESPSWLFSKLRWRQGEQVMLIVAKDNRVNMEKARISLRFFRHQMKQQENLQTTSSTGPLKSETGIELAAHRAVFRRQATSVVICFVSLTFLFYIFMLKDKLIGVYQAAAHLALQSCIYFAACQVIVKKGQRETLTRMLALLCSLTAAHAVAPSLDFSFVIPILRSLVLACCSACLSIAYGYTAEVFPIAIRSTGLCFAYSCGRVGGFLGVVVNKDAVEGHQLALGVILALVVFASAAAIQWLPEVFVKRPPKKPLEPEVTSPQQRKAALKESIASSSRVKTQHREHRRRSKARSMTASPKPTPKQAASPSSQ
ncbi:solute carrier family 22 member 7-like [Dermacentor variabilis]|uniref:solute carrier family 22 member 7-like n=1 Tax=Dermacentor variabilis TaxID=34621 RepID=UPI003F5C076D